MLTTIGVSFPHVPPSFLPSCSPCLSCPYRPASLTPCSPPILISLPPSLPHNMLSPYLPPPPSFLTLPAPPPFLLHSLPHPMHLLPLLHFSPLCSPFLMHSLPHFMHALPYQPPLLHVSLPSLPPSLTPSLTPCSSNTCFHAELKHTFSVLPTNCLNVSVVNVICFP